MRTALEALGLTVDVSASTWTTPEGYRYYNTWSGEPDEFEKWYGQWREKNPYGEPVIRFSERTVLCFPQLSPEEIAERDAKSERREREQAAFQEALAARKEFDRLAYTLRTDWIRKHATGFNGGQLRKATTRLSLLALTGTELCHGLISGASWNNIDNVLAAYNLLAATPLPCDDTSDRGLWRETNLAELHRRQHVEGAANRELLLILCAQIEALIKPGTWADKDDIDLAQTYYHTLSDLGYPTSDEENKALNGCFLPEDDEAE